jgi:2-polyprenyl-3-methyl-5-hydroxy-6-metoxy-1,4-benzoquinol methylase
MPGSLDAKAHLVRDYLACPACRHDLGLDSDGAACADCGRRYPAADGVLVLIPDQQNEYAARLRARYEATTGGSSLPSVFRITRRMLGDVRGRAVLDVGCSQGQFAFEHLLPAGAAAVIGVDFAAGAIRRAQSRATGIPNALFVVGDAMALPVKSNRFDKVVITEVIEHLPDVEACLRELRRAVRSDGDIVLSTPNYFNPVGLFKLFFDRVYHRGCERWTYADHSEELEHFQTPFSVQRQVASAGLVVCEFRGSDLWMGVRKALMVPWLVFDHGLRRALNLWKRDWLSRTVAKYFGVVQYYRLRRDTNPHA